MKWFCAIALGLLCLGRADSSWGDVVMGPSLGLTHTKVTGVEVQSGDAVEESGKLGVAARYRVVLDLKPRIAVETGLGLLLQGAEIEVTETDPDNAAFENTQTGEYGFTTLELPARLRLRLTPPASGIGVVAYVGGALGLRIGQDYDFANVEVNTGTGVATLEEGSDPLDDASTMVLTAVFGVEVEREIKGFLASLSIGYHLGLGDSVNASAPGYQAYSVTAGKTSALEIAVGVGARI